MPKVRAQQKMARDVTPCATTDSAIRSRNLLLEAFRVKARAGESSQHLEASLALGEVTNSARRRQRVSKPCY